MTVSVLGLGAMGGAIAEALLVAGHDVVVWNRTQARGEHLAARGARLAGSAGEAIASGELSLVTVLDTSGVRDVLRAAGDAVRGRVVVNLVTGTPDEARAVAADVRATGGTALDGVMMAVPSMIGTADAMILYGGDSAAYERYRPVLESVAGRSPLLGADVGLPALYDAALLTLLYSTMTGWLQAFALVAENGVTAAEFLPYAKTWFSNVVIADDVAAVADAVDRRTYPDTVPSPVALNATALRLLVAVHEESGVDSGVVKAISALADARVAAGGGADGFTGLIEAIRLPARMASTTVLAP